MDLIYELDEYLVYVTMVLAVGALFFLASVAFVLTQEGARFIAGASREVAHRAAKVVSEGTPLSSLRPAAVPAKSLNKKTVSREGS